MIGVAIEFEDRFDVVRDVAAKARKRALAITGFRVRAKSQSLIRRRPPGSTASAPPGSPPLTRFGRLPNAILYFADPGRGEVIIGTSAARVGEVGGAMELGGPFRGHDYEPRPFLVPGLLAELGTPAREFAMGFTE